MWECLEIPRIYIFVSFNISACMLCECCHIDRMYLVVLSLAAMYWGLMNVFQIRNHECCFLSIDSVATKKVMSNAQQGPMCRRTLTAFARLQLKQGSYSFVFYFYYPTRELTTSAIGTISNKAQNIYNPFLALLVGLLSP